MNPHGLDEPGHVSSAEDATTLLRYALGIPFIRDAVDRTLGRAARRARVPDHGRSARQLAPAPRREDGSHGGRRLVRGRSGTGPRRDRVRHRARRREPYWAKRGAPGAPLVRARPVPPRRRDRRDADVRGGGDGLRPAGRPARRSADGRRHGARGQGRSSSASSPRASSSCPCGRASASGRSRCTTGAGSSRRRSSWPPRAVSEPGWLGKASWYAQQTAANLWGIFS